jgi:hypothetical protein
VIRKYSVGLTILVLAGAFMTGCAGFGTYPGIEGDGANHDPNTVWMQRTMTESLKEAVRTHPVDGPYAVNLPVGMTPGRMEVVIKWLEDEDARLLTAETADLPRYHVERIWIRVQNAEVDILCPTPETTGPDGEAVYQPMTFYLSGGQRKWHVKSSRVWAIGSRQAPISNFYDNPIMEFPTAATADADSEVQD